MNIIDFIVGLIGAVVLVLLALSASLIAAFYYYISLMGPELERDLGFEHGSTDMQSDNWEGYISAVSIRSVAENGVFQRAGFREGDILPEVSYAQLFRYLHRHRGSTCQISVADGGPGPDFYERPRRVIHFDIPPRRWRFERPDPVPSQ